MGCDADVVDGGAANDYIIASGGDDRVQEQLRAAASEAHYTHGLLQLMQPSKLLSKEKLLPHNPSAPAADLALNLSQFQA